VNKILFPLLIIVCLFSYSYSFALEEISFPDATYVITENGKCIEKDVYNANLKLESEKKKEESNDTKIKSGYATFYGSTGKFEGRKTASGEKFYKKLMTAAMNNVKFGTKVKVTNLKNNKSVIVKINDRMGSQKNIIDLSSGAFKKISNLSAGRIKVNVEVIEEVKK